MKKKLWFVCWWNEVFDKDINTRICRNWPNDKFEISEFDYDYLIVLGAFNQNTIKYYKSKDKTIGFMLEPEWSNNWQRDLNKYCKFVVAQDKNMFKNNENVIEHPMFMLTESTDFHNYYLNNDFKKTKRMSFVSSNYDGKFNYVKRNLLFKALLNTDLEIDFYGRRWDITDHRYKGAPFNKSHALVDYEYSIAIENSNYTNYLTEKFFDLIVCNTTPIYYGCPNVGQIYPTNSFISLNLDAPIDLTVEQIKNIYHNDIYNDRLPSILEAKNMYYTKYNIFDFIDSLIKEGKI